MDTLTEAAKHSYFIFALFYNAVFSFFWTENQFIFFFKYVKEVWIFKRFFFCKKIWKTKITQECEYLIHIHFDLIFMWEILKSNKPKLLAYMKIIFPSIQQSTFQNLSAFSSDLPRHRLILLPLNVGSDSQALINSFSSKWNLLNFLILKTLITHYYNFSINKGQKNHHDLKL